jgi:hypothetical protein
VSAPEAAATLAPFHRGAFAVALATGAPVWGMVQAGTEVFAPAGVALGGFPARIRARLFPLWPGSGGSGAFAADEEGQRALDADALAEQCRAAMQRQMDDMLAQEEAERAAPASASGRQQRRRRGGGGRSERDASNASTNAPHRREAHECAPLLVPRGARRGGGSSEEEEEASSTSGGGGSS